MHTHTCIDIQFLCCVCVRTSAGDVFSHNSLYTQINTPTYIYAHFATCHITLREGPHKKSACLRRSRTFFRRYNSCLQRCSALWWR